MLLRYLDIKLVKPELLELILSHSSCDDQRQQLRDLLHTQVHLHTLSHIKLLRVFRILILNMYVYFEYKCNLK